MATTYPQWQNFLGGTLDSAHTDVTTTLTSAALAAMVAVVADDYMKVVLDPDGLDGEPEIVYVSAHTASATTATIVRGQEGTTARAHRQDVPWVHAVVASDVGPTYVAYTPVVSQNGVRTTSAQSGRYVRIGKMVHAVGSATLSNAGTTANAVTVTLPLPPFVGGPAQQVGVGGVQRVAAGLLYRSLSAALSGTTEIRFFLAGVTDGNEVGINPGFALASGDQITWSVTYETIA